VGGENLERNQVDQQHQQPAPVINNNHLPNQQHKGGVSHEQEHKAELALGQKEQEHQQPPNIVAQDQPPAAVVAAQPSPNLSPVEDKVESPPPPAAPIPTPSTNDGSSGSGDPLNLDQNAPPLLQPTVAGNDEGERNRNSAAPAEGIIQTPLPPSSSHEIHHEGKKDADETVAHSHSTIHKPPASEEDIALSPPSEAAPPENANADIGATSSHEPPNNDDVCRFDFKDSDF
jgi:hypothetical protein